MHPFHVSLFVVVATETFDMELTSNNGTDKWTLSSMGASPMTAKVFRVSEHFVADTTFTVTSFGLVRGVRSGVISVLSQKHVRGLAYGDELL